MTDHPIDIVIIDGDDVDKSDFRSFVKERMRLRVASVSEVTSADYSDAFGLDLNGLLYDKDTTDTTSAHDGSSVLVDVVGTRFLLVGISTRRFLGVYSGATTYQIGDEVSYLGASYISIVDGNLNHTPPNASYWQVVAAQGAAGATVGVGFNYSTTTTAADPGSGIFRLNNATLASVTAAYVDNNNRGGIAVSAWLDTFDDSGDSALRGQLLLIDPASSANFAIYKITGSVVDSAGYRTLTLAHVASNGSFTNGAEVTLMFSAAGPVSVDPEQAAAMDAIVRSKSWNMFPALYGLAIAERTAPNSFTVVRATTKNRINAKGLIESVAANTLCHGYHPTTGEYLGWSISGAAVTNLALYSEDASNAAHVKTECTVSANSAVAPDGATTADTVIESALNAARVFRQNYTVSGTGVVVTSSWFVKAAGRTRCGLNIKDSGASNGVCVSFNLTTGAIDVAAATGGSGWTLYGAGIMAYPNGWYRVYISGLSAASTALRATFVPLDASTNMGVLNSVTYAGDGVSGLYVWGGMFHEGSPAHPVDYIATTSASVACAADDLSNTTVANFWNSSAVEGMVVVEGMMRHVVARNVSRTLIGMSDSTSNECVNVTIAGTANNANITVITGGVTQADMDSAAAISADVPFRIAVGFKLNEMGLSKDGATIVTDTSATMPATPTRLDIGKRRANNSNPYFGYIKFFGIFMRKGTSAKIVTLATP